MTRNLASPAPAAPEGARLVWLAGLALTALALALLARVTCICDGNVEFRMRTPAPAAVSLGGTHLRVHRMPWR